MEHGSRTQAARAARLKARTLGFRIGSLALVMSVGLGSLVPPAAVASPGHSEAALGTVDFPISCTDLAREQFNRAIALLHHMTYPQARAAFAGVITTDPQCAMAHWGLAMTLFQPLWPTRPTVEDRQQGWQAVQAAQALEPPTERERLFVAAAEAFFREPAAPDYWPRIARWEQAMETVYLALPEDPEAAAFYALAHLATAPSDRVSLEHSQLAADLLLGVYEKNPEHPGAMHYMVHANDAPGRERELLEIVRKYETVAPDNPHALHMPTHIYTRLGDWDGVVEGNLKAAAAALKHPGGANGELVSDEFPHAIEYLVYAYLQQGLDEKAAAELRRLRQAGDLQPGFKTAFHLASTEARYALERHAWKEAAEVVPRAASGVDWDRFAWPEAVSWFTRGLGAARLGNLLAAGEAIGRLDVLAVIAGERGELLFERNIRVLALAASAWLANAEQQVARSVTLMREAAALEVATPKHAVTPGPTLPAFEQLGDLLLEQGQAKEALAAYRRSLDSYPGRLNSRLGAARAALAAGDPVSARQYYQELLDQAKVGARPAVLREAQSVLDNPGGADSR